MQESYLFQEMFFMIENSIIVLRNVIYAHVY